MFSLADTTTKTLPSFSTTVASTAFSFTTSALMSTLVFSSAFTNEATPLDNADTDKPTTKPKDISFFATLFFVFIFISP